MKRCLIVCLILQNVILLFCIKKAKLSEQHHYHETDLVIVCLTETCKCFLCGLERCIAVIQRRHSMKQTLEGKYFSPLVVVLSLLYFGQNNLTYHALSLVEPGLYSVMIQLKIVFIALFSTLILKRKYSSRQWISFLLLAIGCSVSQVSMDSVIRDRPQVEQVGLSGDDDRI
mmetsp:Transcript_6122/g.21695  ORF Transcript_6122/g.21695 Transcript_6122/m.21695 type:complete len:172 (-) Transcript_6122:503-1018(-)